jgi:Tfp pilus assembly protein PilN
VVEVNGAASIVEARSIGFGDVTTLNAALTAHSPQHLIRVLPAASSVCRLIELPAGSDAEIGSALALIAEAELPSAIPPHRRGYGVVGNGVASHRAAMLLGWATEEQEPAINFPSQSWTSETVALSVLRPPGRFGISFYCDRATGSLALWAGGPNRSVLRSTREDGTAPDRFLRAADELLDQSIAASGLGPDARPRASDAGAQSLRLDPASERTVFDGVAGVRREPAWLSSYGVAAAAALGYARADALAAPLYSLTAAPARERRDTLGRIVAWLANPRRATAVIAISLAFALFGPLAVAAARHAILVAKSGGLEAQQASDQKLKLRSALHSELDKRRWPMTKLLADVSGAMPVGVSAESLRVEAGQRLSLRGHADSLDLVNQFQSRLAQSGVFADVTIDRTQDADPKGPQAGSTEFDLSARIERPNLVGKGLEDFAAQTLAQRLYGDRASLSGAASGRGEGAERASSGDRAGARPASSEDRPARARPRAEDRKAEPPPAPITDEQIAALDATAAMKEWTLRQSASKKPGLDGATRDRLKAEAEKCKARMQAARSEAKK